MKFKIITISFLILLIPIQSFAESDLLCEINPQMQIVFEKIEDDFDIIQNYGGKGKCDNNIYSPMNYKNKGTLLLFELGTIIKQFSLSGRRFLRTPSITPILQNTSPNTTYYPRFRELQELENAEEILMSITQRIIKKCGLEEKIEEKNMTVSEFTKKTLSKIKLTRNLFSEMINLSTNEFKTKSKNTYLEEVDTDSIYNHYQGNSISKCPDPRGWGNLILKWKNLEKNAKNLWETMQKFKTETISIKENFKKEFGKESLDDIKEKFKENIKSENIYQTTWRKLKEFGQVFWGNIDGTFQRKIPSTNEYKRFLEEMADISNYNKASLEKTQFDEFLNTMKDIYPIQTTKLHEINYKMDRLYTNEELPILNETHKMNKQACDKTSNYCNDLNPLLDSIREANLAK